MKPLSFYEQVGVVIPGALFLFGLILIIPEIKEVFVANSISVGGLGVFIIISYAAGQLIAAFGNIFESIYWFLRGGMPSSWIIGENPKLMSSTQISQIEALASKQFSIYFRLKTVSEKDWRTIFWQIFCFNQKEGKTERIDTFNGLYGLNRGLCAATIILAILLIYYKIEMIYVALLLSASVLFLIRMDRFAKHYA